MITADYLHIRRMNDKIMIHHEDGRRLGFIIASTGQCIGSRRGEENISMWLAGVDLTVEGVIEMTKREA